MNTLIDCNPLALGINKLANISPLFSGLSQYLAGLFLNNAPAPVEKALTAIGISAITFAALWKIYKTLSFWRWVPAHYANRKTVTSTNLKEKYGDCFVVVTGCTDGIGYAFTKEIVKLGFGVVLVARNQQKLDKRIREITEAYSEFRYYKVIGDLGDRKQSERVATELQQLAQIIDIGIVVNNAGMSGSISPYLQTSIKELNTVMETNLFSAYLISKALMPSLQKRKNRSALINFSSCTGKFPSHHVNVYPMSKQILDIYTRNIARESSQNVDVLSVRPFGVVTPMMKMLRGKFMITPEDCVISTLADLGKTDTTYTGFMHKVQGGFFQLLSQKSRLGFYGELWEKMEKMENKK